MSVLFCVLKFNCSTHAAAQSGVSAKAAGSAGTVCWRQGDRREGDEMWHCAQCDALI